MILHFGHDLPVEEAKALDCESPAFTSEEMRIIKSQIRKNMAVIDDHIRRIDIFVNHERHASRTGLVGQLHERLGVLMEENDTFRKVLWKQYQNLGANLT
ncbi:MAG: hypothetical protein WC530_00640 [Candidatus Omnitrophota bacterium]|jgi:hypothetical protein